MNYQDCINSAIRLRIGETKIEVEAIIVVLLKVFPENKIAVIMNAKAVVEEKSDGIIIMIATARIHVFKVTGI